MTGSASTYRTLGDRIAAGPRAWRNRMWARHSGVRGRPEVAQTLPEPVLLGDALVGEGLLAGRWLAFGQEIEIGSGSIWEGSPPGERIEAERQSCQWLDDLAAIGNRPARTKAQGWVQDWIRRYGAGRGPGWTPELAGRRAMRWSVHARLLSQGLDSTGTDRFWRALAAHRRYLAKAWPTAPDGISRMRALCGLIWAGIVLPHGGHAAALAELAALSEELVDFEGGTPSRAPEDLAEILMLLIWTARLLDDAGQQAMAPHLAAIIRAVPVVRALRMGDGSFGRFHGGGGGAADRLDQAQAELRLVTQPKPRLPMGFARLSGARMVVVMDGAAPPSGAEAVRAHAGTLAFEMSAGRQPLVVNAGPGRIFGGEWAAISRQTAAHSTVEVDGRSSARIAASGGAPLTDGPTLVGVRQAQDASGQWLLATQDGYVASHGLLQERRIFVDARGTELRGEEILTVADARARAQFERYADRGRLPIAVRFHLHPAVAAEHHTGDREITLTLPSGEVWLFHASGGAVALEDSVHFDPARAEPSATMQVVVHGEVVEYLGQVTWSFSRIAEAPAES